MTRDDKVFLLQMGALMLCAGLAYVAFYVAVFGWGALWSIPFVVFIAGFYTYLLYRSMRTSSE